MFEACRVQLLGDLRLRAGGREITAFKTKKVAELLAFLAFHRGRTFTRGELADILWPDEYDDATRFNRLSHALSYVRSTVEPTGVVKGAVLESNRFSARLRAETVELDVLEFKAAIRAGSKSSDLQSKVDYGVQAVQLYMGDFAPILDSDWVHAERVRLQDAYALLLADLCNLLELAGDLARAIEFGNRLVQLDEYSEPAHAAMIRLYLTAGRESAARDQLAALRRALEELDAKPSNATLSLFESVSSKAPVLHMLEPRNGAVAPLEDAPFNERSLPKRKASLPFQITRFFGREAEISQTVALIRHPDTRLVSLIGIGGSGKTRLAIEIAKELSESFDGNVFFAGLADITDSGFILDVILGATGGTRDASIPPLDQIEARLSSLPTCLLIVDNLEHLVDDVVPVVQELLSRVAALKIITTCRRTLDLSGEKEIRLQPLPLPDYELEPAAMMRYPSIALFVDRAQSVCAEFHLSARNAPAVAELCARLDGLPLAIELAATWAKLLNPQGMLRQLSRRFDFLVTRRRDVPVRHQKMLAIIETSYLQLEPGLRSFFLKLSVFQGGWTTDSAAAVCEEPRCLEYLRELLERTLITSQQTEFEGMEMTRCGMLETTKAFASTLLEPEDGECLRRTHALYYLGLAQAGKLTHADLPLFSSELNNIRAAISWFISSEQGDDEIELIYDTRSAWVFLGLQEEVMTHVEGLSNVSHAREDDLPARARFLDLRTRFWVDTWRSDDMYPMLEETVSVFKALGDLEGVTFALLCLCGWFQRRGQTDKCLPILEEALEFLEASGSGTHAAKWNSHYGLLLQEQGDIDSARVYLRKAVQVSEGHQNSARCCMHLASLEIEQECWDAAEEWLEQARKRLQTLVDVELMPWLHYHSGVIATSRLNLAAGREHLVEALQLSKLKEKHPLVHNCLVEMSEIAFLLHEDYDALVFHSAALVVDGAGPMPGEGSKGANHSEVAASRLGKLDAEKAIAEGKALDYRSAIKLALTWNPTSLELFRTGGPVIASPV